MEKLGNDKSISILLIVLKLEIKKKYIKDPKTFNCSKRKNLKFDKTIFKLFHDGERFISFSSGERKWNKDWTVFGHLKL